MIKFFTILALATLMMASTNAEACSPQKLSILKNKCTFARTAAEKSRLCAQYKNPHSVKFVNERNYNIGQKY